MVAELDGFNSAESGAQQMNYTLGGNTGVAP